MAALLLVLAASLAIPLPGAGGAAHAAVLVSNVGQTSSDTYGFGANDFAQSFTTGANAAGYTLTSIELRLGAFGSTSTPTVKLYSGSATGTEVATTFTGPAMLNASSVNNYTFTPSSTVTLGMSTTYWVVAEGTADVTWVVTGSTSEDGTPATGWEIADGYENRAASSTGSFTTFSGAVLHIRVNGTTVGTPPANTAATGEPSISGTATVGQVLTATTGTIADADGLPSSFTYQWVRVDADGTSNEADITGANSSTYTLDGEDEGKKIKVKVSFTDNGGNSEMRTSGAYPTSGTVQASTTPGSAALVSNIGQTVANLAELGVVDIAQPFTTGTNATGYTLTSIELTLNSSRSTDTPTVKLYSGSANGTEVSTFTGPAMLDTGTTNDYTLTPSSTVTLRMSTTYWVVAEANTGDVRWLYTGSTGEDATPAAGWEIGDVGETRTASSTGSFTRETGSVFMIRVNGTLGGIVISSDATLSALALEDASDDSAITISPVFASGTTSYTASVDNDVDEITIKPTVNEGSATVEYLDSSDTEITDADGVKAGQQVSLDVGTNTIKVEVTAEDTTTTNTYTVVVTRAAAVPGVVTVSESALTVTEEDTTGDTYTVVLGTQPTADVTVTVGGHASTEVTPTPASLTFTTANWSTAQTVTVTATTDTDLTNDTVTLTHSAASTDPGYSGITIDSVVVTVTDNDTAQVTGVVVTSGNARLVVNWAAVGNATGYKVQWKSGTESYDTTTRQATITPGTTTSHTITGLTNGTAYTVQVTAMRTGASDGPSSDEEMGTPEAQGVTVSKSALTVTEQNATGNTYTVVLDTRPTANVMVTVFVPGGTDVTLTSLAFTSSTPSSGTLTFTTANWNQAQTVTVKAGNDADTENDTVTLTHSAASTDGNYNGITIGSVVVTVEDNDTAQVTGVVVTSGNAGLLVNWVAVGNATGYKVQWKSGSESYNDTTRQATITSGSTISHTIPGLTNGTEYTVQVTATRTGASDGLPSAGVMGTPEAQGVTISESALTVTEEDTTGDSYTVVLNTQPTANVTVTVAGHSGTDVTPTPASLTFTMANWSTAQTVTVTATTDTDLTNDMVTLTHSAASTDTNYNGITIAGVTVTVTDNDTAQVTGVVVTSGNAGLLVNWAAVGNATGYKVQWKSGTQGYNTTRQATITSGSTTSHTIAGLTNGTEYTVQVTATRTGANDGLPSAGVMGTPEAPGVTVSESALMVTEEDTTGNTYTVVLDTRPTVNVTVTVSGHGGTDVTPTPASLTFTTTNWNTAQTVTVTATNDTDTTNDTVTLTHSATSTDSNYGGITIGSVVVTVEDNDTARVTGVVVTSGNARLVVNWAAVGNATGYKVQWKSGTESYDTTRQFTATSGSTTSHTIPSLTNGTEYTVRVTATRTGASDGPPSAEVMETPAVPTAPGVTVSTMALTVTEENTTGNTYTVVLDTQPTASVTVTVAGHAGTEVTLTPSSGTLTFTTTNWSRAQTVTVKAGNDTDTTNDTVTLAHSATSTDGNYGGITIAGVTVTVTDNDTAQVTGVTVASGNARLVVNWVAVGNATGYKVQWKSGSQSYDNTRQFTATPGTTTSHTIPSLTNGTEYTVRVTATRTGANDGLPSAEVMETPGAPGVTVSTMALTVTEQNATGGTYTVVLDTQPTVNVTVTVAGHAGTDVTLTPSSGTLTFTTTNWNTAQTVTVKAGNDADTTNDTVTLTHSATSTDSNYGGITIGSVVVMVTDNDTARVTGVTVAAGNARLVVNWAAVGNATGYKVQWKSGTQSYNTGNRQFTATPGTTTSHPITGLTNGTEYTVRVTATRMGASDGLPSAEVMETPEVVTAAGVTVSTMALTVTEENTTGDTYTVVLGTQPTANVTVTVAGHAGTDVTLTPSSSILTFTTTNWSTAQTVTVTAGNDTDTTNDRVTLTHSATSTDPGYNGIMIGSVVVTVTDNDVVTPPQPVNAPPEFGGSSATRSMDETVGGGAAGTAVKVGAPVTAVDPDGDTIEYSLLGTDRDKFDINRNTGQLLSRAGERYDHEEKSSYEVRVSASDGEGGTDTIEVAISINNVSEAPEAPGAPRVRASGMTALGISWSAPRNAGRPDITGYDLRYRNTAETDWSDGPRGVEETETEVPGLLEDTEYEVQVRAVNAEGSGEWSEPASGRTGMQPVGIAAAWLGRFGRTVAEHVLSGVSARITALRSSGMKATLGGLDLLPVKSPDELPPGHDDTEEFTDWFGEEEEDSFRFLTLASNDIETRSSFALGRSSGGGFGAVWGSGAFGGFNGRESGVSFDGEVRTGMLGADYAVGSLVAGVALSRSVGEGSYRNGRGSGKVKSSVTGIYPYAGNDLSEKFSVWAVAGYGRGEMGVTLPGEGERSSADIDIKMAAAGARGDLVSGANEAGIGVSVEMDTLFVRTTSDGGRGIEATDADVSRVRLSVQGSVGHAFGGGGMIRPLVEAGIRRDGGDAEAGFGADLGAGLQFSDATGELSMQIRGRTLIVHEAGGFRDWGVSGSIRYDPYPDSPRGLMMSLGHSAGGASDGGADALLGRGTLAGLGEGEAVEWNSRLVGEAGYGFGVLGGVFTGTPYAGFGASEGLRDYYLGLRLARMNRNAFDLEFGVEATREESAGAYDPIHGMTFRLALRR